MSKHTGSLALAITVTLAFFTKHAMAQDLDQDGLDDAFEDSLLEKFRPFFAFAGNETFRPTDVRFYIQNSNLLKSGDENQSPLIDVDTLRASPDAVLTANLKGKNFCSDTLPGPGSTQTCVSSLFLNRRQTDYRINPLAHPPGSSTDNPARHGEEWSQELEQKNIGLFGHVVPVHLQNPFFDCHTRWTFVPEPESAPLFIKVEYWQFFGYNSNDKPFDIGDHEGDWTSVQLLLKPIPGDGRRAPSATIVSVMMYAHGLEIRFNLMPSDSVLPSGDFQEHRGANFGKSVNIALNGQQCDKAVLNAQNNVIRFAPDDKSGEFTHPVVFLERGSHESWPTTGFSYKGAQKHDGKGANFLVATPPNLGEVEHPLTEYGTALPILRFNGLWGAYGRLNTPPPGPPLHGQWTWPATSSIGWLLPKSLGY